MIIRLLSEKLQLKPLMSKVLAMAMPFFSFAVGGCFNSSESGSGNSVNEMSSDSILLEDSQRIDYHSNKLLSEAGGSGKEDTGFRQDSNRNSLRLDSNLEADQPFLSFRHSYENRAYSDRSSVRNNQNDIIKNGGNAYHLMQFSTGFSALITMFEATDTLDYIYEALDLAEGIIKTAKRGKDIANNPKIFKDNFLGWENVNSRFDETKKGGQHLQEIPLFESYLLRYLAKLVYVIEKDERLSNNVELRERNSELLDFVKKNGWEKWYSRGELKAKGCYPYLFRSRTHMTANWAMVALFLRELTQDPAEISLFSDYLGKVDKQLKSNLRVTEAGAYLWNMTWDKPWPIGSSCNKAANKPIIQDVSHGNHVISYIIESHEILNGKVWNNVDIQRFCNTLKQIVFDKQKNHFNGDLNGKHENKTLDGVALSDGFLKLCRYDKSLAPIFKSVYHSQHKDRRFRLDEPQYVAELKFAERLQKQDK